MLDSSIRDTWIQWLNRQSWDFFVTLNLNCNSNENAAKRHFRKFCQWLDRRVLGTGWYLSPRRTLIVAVAEHMSSNFHFHCLVKQRGNFLLPPGRIETLIAEAWASVLEGGSCDVRPVDDVGRRTAYMSKEMWKEENYEMFLISPERAEERGSATGNMARARNDAAVSNCAGFDGHLLTGSPVSNSRESAMRAATGANMSVDPAGAFHMKASKYFLAHRNEIARYLQTPSGRAQSSAIVAVVVKVASKVNSSAKWRKSFESEADAAGVRPTRPGSSPHLRLMRVLGINKPGVTMNRWAGRVTQSLLACNSAGRAHGVAVRPKGKKVSPRRTDRKFRIERKEPDRHVVIDRPRRKFRIERNERDRHIPINSLDWLLVWAVSVWPGEGWEDA